MEDKIRIGIVGYGNLGKGAKIAINQSPDMKLVAVFTRRPVEHVKVDDNQTKVLNVSIMDKYVNDIDVMILCGGSATTLPAQGPHFASMYNTVDSYDTHAKIPDYFKAMDDVSKTNKKTSAICIGWDPGLFSMNRILGEAILPMGKEYTFWGPGVSQGHTDAIKRIPGVKNAVQYTIPIGEAIERVRNGENPELSIREKHIRGCFVVIEDGIDKDRINEEIKSMPNYFSNFDTKISFITEEEIIKNHRRMPHGGFVIRSGSTGENGEMYNHIMEFSLKLDSNPRFTASILVAYARAVYRLNKEGNIGAKTVFDIPLGYLSPKSPEDLRKSLL